MCSVYSQSSYHSPHSFPSLLPLPHKILEVLPSKALIFRSDFHGHLTQAKRSATCVEKEGIDVFKVQHTDFPGGSVVKNPPADAGDSGWIPGWGRSPGEGKGKPFQSSYLGNPINRGLW